jgi:glutaminase
MMIRTPTLGTPDSTHDKVRSSLGSWLLVMAAVILIVPWLAAQAQSTPDVQRAVDGAYSQFKTLQEGKNADYIPALAKVDPQLFGIALVHRRR